jgi:26S proteasome non-ATPase regulatory subunit 9
VQHEDKKPRLHDTPADSAAAAKPAAAAQGAQQGSSSATLRPFAVVDEMADGSPAAAAGIQLGDQLCRCAQMHGMGVDTGQGSADM